MMMWLRRRQCHATFFLLISLFVVYASSTEKVTNPHQLTAQTVTSQSLILPPIIDPGEESNNNGTFVVPEPEVLSVSPFWIYFRFFHNDSSCLSESNIRYMDGVRSGKCLQDLDFLQLFVSSDHNHTANSYRFTTNATTHGQECSAVKLERFYDHHCMHAYAEEDSRMISADMPSNQANNSAESTYFGQCRRIWHTAAQAGYLQLTCSAEIFVPEVNMVSFVYSRTFVNPDSAMCLGEVPDTFTWYRSNACVSLDGKSSMEPSCLPLSGLIMGPVLGIGGEMLTFRYFNDSVDCTGPEDAYTYSSHCTPEYEEDEFPTFSPTASPLARRLEAAAAAPTSQPSFYPLAAMFTEAPTYLPTEAPSWGPFNRLYSEGCMHRTSYFGNPFSDDTSSPTFQATPSPPPTRQVQPILMMKVGFTISPAMGMSDVVNSSIVRDNSATFVCKLLEVAEDKCTCNDDCLSLVPVENTDSIVLSNDDHELIVRVDVAVHMIDFLALATNQTALFTLLTDKFIQAMNIPTNPLTITYRTKTISPFFDYFYGSGSVLTSPTTSLSFVQFPPTAAPTNAPTSINVSKSGLPVEGVIGIVLGVFGAMLLLLCISGYCMLRNWQKFPSQLAVGGAQQTSKVQPEP